MNKNTSIIIVILCFALCFANSEAQRRGSSRSSHHWSKLSRKQRNNIDFSTIFVLNPNKQAKLSLDNTVKLWIFRAIFATIGLSFLYSDTTNRDNKIVLRFKTFSSNSKKKREPSIMSKKQCDAFVDSLKSKQFTMTFWQKDKGKSWSCKMVVILIIKLSQAVYEMGFQGTDDFVVLK